MKNITLKYYKGKGSKCFNRTKRNNKQNAIVDAHLHMRPFGGPPIEFKKMIDILNKNGILFAVIKGIGQRLPTGHTCTYYKNCPGVNIRPSDVISCLTDDKYKDEVKRITESDTKYPIIVDSDLFIIDGMHRLVKNILNKKKETDVYIFDKKLMKKFIVGTRDEKINLKLNDYIELYNERF